jgi:hypothetical protein
MKCCLCGGNDLPLHRYGESSTYSKTPGKVIYACSSCDPVVNIEAPKTHHQVTPLLARIKGPDKP